MYYQLPTREAMLTRAAPHSDKLTLGKIFPSYQAGWTGVEADEFLDLVDDLCLIIDHIAPKLLDRAWSDRARELGVAFEPGVIMRGSREQLARDGGYTALMEPNCQLLRQAAGGEGTCAWNVAGCSALYNLLETLIHKATVLTPAILKGVSKATEAEMPRFVATVA